MIVLYPLLIELVIELKIEAKRVNAKYSKLQCEILEEDESCSIAAGYRLEKDQSTGKIYCLKNHQTIGDRIEKMGKLESLLKSIKKDES